MIEHGVIEATDHVAGEIKGFQFRQTLVNVLIFDGS